MVVVSSRQPSSLLLGKRLEIAEQYRDPHHNVPMRFIPRERGRGLRQRNFRLDLDIPPLATFSTNQGHSSAWPRRDDLSARFPLGAEPAAGRARLRGHILAHWSSLSQPPRAMAAQSNKQSLLMAPIPADPCAIANERRDEGPRRGRRLHRASWGESRSRCAMLLAGGPRIYYESAHREHPPWCCFAAPGECGGLGRLHRSSRTRSHGLAIIAARGGARYRGLHHRSK